MADAPIPAGYSASDGAFVKALFLVGDGASPETFTPYCDLTALDEIGVKKSQIDVTTICSPGVKEYIGGIADGTDFTFTGNLSTLNVVQESLMDSADAGEVRNFKLEVGDDSPPRTLTFGATLLGWSWVIDPGQTKQAQAKFSAKVSGKIVDSARS